jgi:diguanylate cyclase (GGDEF)-like protein
VHLTPHDNARSVGSTILRPRRWRISTRLAYLVVVAFGCVSLMAAAVTTDRVTAANHVGTIQDEAGRLGRFVEVRSTIHAERVGTEALLRAASFGMDDDSVEPLLGFRPHQRVADSVVATDRALDVLGAENVVIDRAALADLRTRVDAGTVESEEAVARYTEMDDRVRSTIVTMLSSLEQIAAGTADGTELHDTLDGVRAASVVLDEVNVRLNDLGSLFLVKGDLPTLHDSLVASATRSQIAAGQLERVRSPEIRASWDRIRQSDDFRMLEDVVGRTIAQRAQQAPDIELIASAARAGLSVERQLYGLVSTATEAVRDGAGQARADAISQLWGWVVFAVALLAVAVLVPVRLARSIIRPMRRLRSQAFEVSSGNLDVEPLDHDGPADVAPTMAAFDDLVANLRLLEGKAQALAACEFDSPILERSLPGQLGASLQQSVQVLSGSIVERDELQRHLSHQATHDSLTGLYNRAAGTAALEQALRRAQRTGMATAVLFIDLDDFKQANDTHGHAVGDRVLQGAAHRLKAMVRESDVLARLGGDEFMVITENIDDPSDAGALADRVAESFREAIRVDDLEISIGACVGIALARDGHDDPDQLMAWADLAVYRAKHRGRGQIAMYDESLQRELIERSEIHAALTQGLRDDELFLNFQPVVDADGAISGLEALVRWDRPGIGIQPPDTFIPVAESSNLIIDLDCWVLESAARQLLAWVDVPALGHVDMSVNISGRHLMSGKLPEHIRDVLDRTGLPPQRLIIEVTETVLIGDLPTAADQLSLVRGLGVRVAIDDFGTGYTSVTHLQQLPVDVMKIDRSFVNQGTDERGRTLLAMMIDVGHHLGMTITAEGVETSEQLQMLNELACDDTQGFLLCRPLAADRLCEWLAEAPALLHPAPSSR